MAIIVAEPGKKGTWDGCLVELGSRSDESMSLQYLRLQCKAPDQSLAEFGKQILQQTRTTPVESVLLLTNAHTGASLAAVIHNGSLVRIEVIDALTALNRVLPATSDCFLLIDLSTPQESVLMRRNGNGELAPAIRLPLPANGFGKLITTRAIRGSPQTKNGKRTRSLAAYRSDLKLLLAAANLLGITKVVIRASLADSFPRWSSTLPKVAPGNKKMADIVFLSAREIVKGALKASQCGDTPPAVVLSESPAAAVLTMTYRRDISYTVLHPARPVLDLEEESLAQIANGRPVLLVIDNNVERLFSEKIQAYADRHLNCIGSVIVAGRERNKSWNQVERVCSHAVNTGLPRHGVIAAFGGGVAMDLAGTAASLFRRGVAYVRLPTTLVGMVDTAVGIKQGFNFLSKKNVLGSFYPPTGVINDPTFLASLPQIELSCGMAEIIKIALLRDADFVQLLERNAGALLSSRFQSPPDLARRVLLRAEQLMMQELQPNLYESCHARLADFGHTFSPTLERISRYTMRHGHAVALDMLISTGIAIARGLCEQQLLYRMVRLYTKVGLPLKSSFVTVEALLAGARDSCLHRSGKLNLVVPLNFGKAMYLQDLKRKDLKSALARLEQVTDGAKLSKHPGHSF